MKYTWCVLALAAGVAAQAQDDPFVAGMKATKASMEVLSKAEKQSGKQVTSAGERLASIYENMIPYWRQRGAADAVKISVEGKAAATAIASASFAGNEAGVAEAMKTLGGTCKACHDAHREKTADGAYKIK